MAGVRYLFRRLCPIEKLDGVRELDLDEFEELDGGEGDLLRLGRLGGGPPGGFLGGPSDGSLRGSSDGSLAGPFPFSGCLPLPDRSGLFVHSSSGFIRLPPGWGFPWLLFPVVAAARSRSSSCSKAVTRLFSSICRSLSSRSSSVRFPRVVVRVCVFDISDPDSDSWEFDVRGEVNPGIVGGSIVSAV
jgi:hypothetical protein